MVRNGLTYDVILKFLQTDMNDPNKINNITVKTLSGSLVPLSNIVTITPVVSPNSSRSLSTQRAATINVVLKWAL